MDQKRRSKHFQDGANRAQFGGLIVSQGDHEESTSPKGRITTFLKIIPTERDSAQRVTMLCERAGWSTDAAPHVGAALVELLRPFGALVISRDTPASDVKIKSESMHAYLFLQSLRAYLEEDKAILSDWGRHAAADGPLYASDASKGPQFLYLIERQRSTGESDVVPIRETEVSQVIIKARVRALRSPRYLVQYDTGANQYQLIGGHYRHGDNTPTVTVEREIVEEIPRSQFRFGDVDRVRELDSVNLTRLSRSAGANTRYNVHFFFLEGGGGKLSIGPADRWVTEKELRQGRARDGQSIGNDFILALEPSLVGGLAALPLSFEVKQQIVLRQYMREHALESLGVLVGIIGIAVSIVIWVVS